jgi:hypothetical protein
MPASSPDFDVIVMYSVSAGAGRERGTEGAAALFFGVNGVLVDNAGIYASGRSWPSPPAHRIATPQRAAHPF